MGDLAEVVYEDRDGTMTRRRIRVAALYPLQDGGTFVRAWCFLRGEERTFRLDRFREWTAVEGAVQQAPVPAAAPAARPAPAPAARARGGGARYGIGSALAAGVVFAIVRGAFSPPAPEPPQYRIPPAPIAPPAARATPRAAARPAPTRLERLYAGADLDHSGRLSWSELKAFQADLKRNERYFENDTVLRPAEFLAQGGGDCDDWAAFTASLLRYWGWESYVGCFKDPAGADGHAVCLVRLKDKPSRFMYFAVSEPGLPGFYVPVDYEVVGGISNAMGSDWTLQAIYAPQDIYGAAM